jgi:hypothetical protein
MTSQLPELLEARACYNECIRKGTENDEQPALLTASHGYFCDKEWFAMKSALGMVAEVTEHVVSLIGSHATSDDNVQTTREAPLPFNVQAFHDANETYSRMVYWAQLWARRIGRNAPNAAVNAWYGPDGKVIGLPYNVQPSSARYVVLIMSQWMIANLDDICRQLPSDDVLYFHDEMADIFRIAARWPFKMKARFAKIPCPQDGTKIAVYPPSFAGDEMRIVCGMGHIYDEDRFEFYVKEFAQIQATTKHLTKKHATV